jgi:hypothetical protein
MLKTITEPLAPILIEDLGMQYPTEKSKEKKHLGIYKCSCGVHFKSYTVSINSGNTKSCGCYNKVMTKEANTTHGLSKHILYKTWQYMINRCNNPKNKRYKDYGERGITVCERWMKFENFRDDMFSKWQEGLSIDRIDVNGNYEPSNCRWATKEVQSRNTRPIQSNNTSGFRGVSFQPTRNKWVSYIMVSYKRKTLGRFNTALEAAKSYDAYVINNNLEHTINGVL